MAKSLTILCLFLCLLSQKIVSQEETRAEVYLLTCGPGTETYSIYGHTALRIVLPERGTDLVYNWGVFDFSTPNFAWKFARGRLNYMLGVSTFENFLKEYVYEKRWVISQRVNLSNDQINTLFTLINENLKPENIQYLYDFFYDNCSTRVRDLLEKSTGKNLIYPPDEPLKSQPTFRQKIREYQKNFAWLNFGIDLLLGSPADRKASFRDRMFLPVDLYTNMSKLLVNTEGKMIPLLQNPVTVVSFDNASEKPGMINSPLFLFSILAILVIILSGTFRGKKFNNLLDISLFAVFSILALMMIFFNFFTDHHQLKWNLNVIWLNPFIPVCLASLVLNKNWQTFFRICFFLALFFLVFIAILPQQINDAFVPLIIILLIRTSARSGFKWNPLTLPYLT
ncbi:MAG: DUF4105 domain-containing protein [Bacteroidales bacterium]|nr:DUF4105 domain-containing protein [Bacteroidales bacterium]